MKQLTTLTLLMLLALTASPQQKSDYNIPIFPWSIVTGDINADGEVDVVIRHSRSWQASHPSLTILLNNSQGSFLIADTTQSYCGNQDGLFLLNLDNNEFPDLPTFYADFSSGEAERYLRVFYNNEGNFEDFIDFPLNTSTTLSNINYGNINDDDDVDIVVSSNSGQFLGVLYNDGSGHFGTPEYHYVDDTHPTDLDCGDLNGDGRDDVLLCGNRTLIYYSDTAGFMPDSLPKISLGAEIVDFDGDGDNDIILFSPLGYVNTYFYLYENINNNSFELAATDTLYNTPIHDIQSVDFDNDGLPDLACLAIAPYSGSGEKAGISILYNSGNNTFSENTKYVDVESYNENYRHFHCNDLDGNGYNDIAVTRAPHVSDIGYNLTLLFNDGEGNFVDSPQTGLHTLSPDHPQLTAWPNPFTRQITFQIPSTVSHKAALYLHNLAGQRIATLTIQKQKEGQHTTITWNGHNTQNHACAPGIYVASLVVDGEVRQTTKIIKTY